MRKCHSGQGDKIVKNLCRNMGFTWNECFEKRSGFDDQWWLS
jgi:hypothetical protein